MYKIVLILFLGCAYCDNFTSINLPEEHLPYYFTNFPKEAERCQKDEGCPFKKHVGADKCWGYEYNCKKPTPYFETSCNSHENNWLKSKEDALKIFYDQGDFGYIAQQMQEMSLLCEPTFADDSSLECSDHMRFCRGRNLMINFTSLLNRDEQIRYKMDVLKEGEIGNLQDGLNVDLYFFIFYLFIRRIL